MLKERIIVGIFAIVITAVFGSQLLGIATGQSQSTKIEDRITLAVNGPGQVGLPPFEGQDAKIIVTMTNVGQRTIDLQTFLELRDNERVRERWPQEVRLIPGESATLESPSFKIGSPGDYVIRFYYTRPLTVNQEYILWINDQFKDEVSFRFYAYDAGLPVAIILGVIGSIVVPIVLFKWKGKSGRRR